MIVGVGGQGTLLASRIIGNVAIKAGYDVKVSEVHGMSQRGGSVVTYVKYSDKVYSPLIFEGEADFLLAFEELEAYRWLPYLKKDGKLDNLDISFSHCSFYELGPKTGQNAMIQVTTMHSVYLDYCLFSNSNWVNNAYLLKVAETCPTGATYNGKAVYTNQNGTKCLVVEITDIQCQCRRLASVFSSRLQTQSIC